MTLSQQLSSLLHQSVKVLPQERLAAYAVDGQTPQAVAQPANRQEVAQVLQWASAERLAVCPWGGGTQMALGNLPRRVDVALDLTRLDRLLDFQPADLTCTVEAGMTLEALQAALAQGGKFLPVEAPRSGRATIGGILATGATGPLRFAYGLPRDWLIGIGVVSAQGVASKAGGKVVKNVTGYDLNKLYTGSLGTLGVIVEATFKLSPRPTDFAALVATFPSAGRAIQAGQQLAGQVFAPQGVQMVTGMAAQRLALGGLEEEPGKSPQPPFGKGGQEGTSSGTVQPRGGDAVAIAFFAGRAQGVRRRLEESQRLLQAQGASDVATLQEAAGRELLLRLTDLGWSAETAPWLGLKVNALPSAVGQVVAWLEDYTGLGQDGAGPGVIADPGFGTVRLLQWREDAPAQAGIGRLRDQVRKLSGSVVVEQCPLEMKRQIDVWDPDSSGLEVMRRLKERFDPLGILNPGRFAGRL